MFSLPGKHHHTNKEAKNPPGKGIRICLGLELHDYFSLHCYTATFKQVKIYLVKCFVFFLEDNSFCIITELGVHGENCDPQDELLLVTDINSYI